MKTILCILAVFVLTASTADAYVRRAIGGGYVVRGAGAFSGRYAGGYYGRGYYGHPVARGAAVAAGAAAVAATGWGGGYYGGYGTDEYYGAYAAEPVAEAPVDYDVYAAGPVVAAPVFYCHRAWSRRPRAAQLSDYTTTDSCSAKQGRRPKTQVGRF